MKIIRVTKEFFETDTGEIFKHPAPLKKVPSLKEFQDIYNKWEKELKKDTEENEVVCP